ncbi:MAG: DNA replication/repair protein RecF [Holosporales bacterium]
MSTNDASKTAGTVVRGLSRLVLTNFRNYSFVELDLTPQPVVLLGPNGAGKTNLLEAISFLAPGRGLRRARLAEVTRHAAPFPTWGVAATLQLERDTLDVGTSCEVNDGRERRFVKVGGELLKSQAQLSQYLSVLWLTPQMDGVLAEGGSGRRKFLDRLVYALDPDHASRVYRYEYCVRERNKLLENPRYDPAWATSLEAKIAAEGVAIAAARSATIARLDQAFAHAMGPFPRPVLSLEGWVDRTLEHQPALMVEEELQALLAQNRERDAAAGGCFEGPHKSDFKVVMQEKGMPAELCSTGEQKALLLSIILASARLQRDLNPGAVPLLLLDEVVAHLDAGRRQALFDEILNLQIQVWMTGVDLTLFQGLAHQAQHFFVNGGTVAQSHSEEGP